VETAALMNSLDLVISSDTAVAHLAGALGVPAWVALGVEADWRWLRDRPDSVWYPTMRLFRQKAAGDWEEVFERMAAELSCPGARRPLPFRVEVSPGELLDKITILEIKRERIGDPEKLRHVAAELAELEAACAGRLADSPELRRLRAELRRVNEALWD